MSQFRHLMMMQNGRDGNIFDYRWLMTSSSQAIIELVDKGIFYQAFSDNTYIAVDSIPFIARLVPSHTYFYSFDLIVEPISESESYVAKGGSMELNLCLQDNITFSTNRVAIFQPRPISAYGSYHFEGQFTTPANLNQYKYLVRRCFQRKVTFKNLYISNMEL